MSDWKRMTDLGKWREDQVSVLDCDGNERIDYFEALVCPACGAYVATDMQKRHEEWHLRFIVS